MKAVVELLRGEPLVLRSIVVAVLTAVGVQVADGTVEAWIAILAPVALALITRGKVTPANNPEIPTTIAVKADDEDEVPAGQQPLQLPPIRTITHPLTVR